MFLTSGICKIGLQEIKQAYRSLCHVWMKAGLLLLDLRGNKTWITRTLEISLQVMHFMV